MYKHFIIFSLFISSCNLIIPAHYQEGIDATEEKIVIDQRLLRDLRQFQNTCLRKILNAEQSTQLHTLKEETQSCLWLFDRFQYQLNFLKGTRNDDSLRDLIDQHSSVHANLDTLWDETMEFYNSLSEFPATQRSE